MEPTIWNRGAMNSVERGRPRARWNAFAEYRLLASGILFPHTLVPEALEGRGIAKAMAEAALGFARERGLKVMPTCTFFAGYIARHPEHHDLVHPDYRRALHLD